MTLLIALLLAAAPAPQKPPLDGKALELDCSAYLANALGEAEKRGRLDQPLQRAFEAWFDAYLAGGDRDGADFAGAAMAERSSLVGKLPRKTQRAHTAWCRANAPLEKSA